MINVETDLRRGREARSRDDIIIVVDVFRFSSSVITGLASGIDAFIPVKTLSHARSLYKRDKLLLLAGERNGIKPKDFHLGNSPIEFMNSSVKGKSIVMTTSNGTLALEFSRGAKWLLMGSFLNADAVSRRALMLSKSSAGISIILSSARRHIFLEDFLCAGLLVSNITSDLGQMNDEAIAANLAWISSKDNYREVLMHSSHAAYLENIGYRLDVEFCLRKDIYDLVPYVKNNRILKL